MLNRNSLTYTLLPYLLKIDFKDSGKGSTRKIFGIVLSALFTTTVLSVTYFNFFNKESFIFITSTVNFLFISMFIFSDFPNLFFSKSFRDALLPLPVKYGDFVRLKFRSGLIYIFSIIMISNLSPAVLLYFFDNNVLDSLKYIVLAGITSSLLAMLFIEINLMIISAAGKKHKILLYVFQIFFIFFVFYLNKLLIRETQTDVFKIHPEFKYFPLYLLNLAYNDVIYIPLILILFVIIFFITSVQFVKSYDTIYELLNKPDSLKKEIKSKFKLSFNFIERFIRNKDEAAGYFLAAKLFRNSAAMKMKVLPIMFIPLVSTAVLYFTAGTFLLVTKDTIGMLPLLHPSISITLLMCLRIAVSVTKTTSGEDLPYDFTVLPVKSIHYFKSGTLKFIYTNLYFPLLAILFFITALKTSVTAGALNIFFIFAVADFINNIINLFDKTMPFSLDPNVYNSSRKFLDIFIVTIAGILLIFLQMVIFSNVIFVLITIIVFIILSYVLKKLLYKKAVIRNL